MAEVGSPYRLINLQMYQEYWGKFIDFVHIWTSHEAATY